MRNNYGISADYGNEVTRTPDGAKLQSKIQIHCSHGASRDAATEQRGHPRSFA